MDYAEYNRRAWDQQVKRGNEWTVPVSEETIAAVRTGDWHVVLTPQEPVPKSWFPSMAGLTILGLASGGGQQAPIFAAAGAHVTVIDNSPLQLEQDQIVARREGLAITSVLGDMRDLSQFPPDSFDLIFNPCSMSFISDARSVFDQSYRVLKSGGRLLCGFTNPTRFIFDEDKLTQNQLTVRHKLPYGDTTHLTQKELEKLRSTNEPFICSHSLEDLIAGQLKAGFTITDMYEDVDDKDPLAEFLPIYFATLAEKHPPRSAMPTHLT
jgi:ubiquinone/menaquinone biosynthesis C-methylase UbiE